MGSMDTFLVKMSQQDTIEEENLHGGEEEGRGEGREG